MPEGYGMNRNHLALFHAVAQAGGISAGAAAARVSQPAVSKQIAELESALGVQLLERLPRGCRLTEAGEILASYAARWRTLEADAAQAIEEYRGLKRGRLNVGASLTIAGYLLPRALAEFHRQYPEIELRVRTANTRQIQAALLEGSLELGLTEGVHDAPELDSEVFLEDELVAIAPPKHPFLKRGDVTAREFCREPLILREPGSGTRAAIEQALRRKKLSVEPLLSLGSPEAIKGAVCCGMGLAIVSRLSVDQELRSGALAIVALQDLTIRRPLRRQRLRGRNESPAAARFRQVLVAVVGDR
ncbi:MAG: LysR substrate-binding domain-containing protein [Opitutaceae bacterium]